MEPEVASTAMETITATFSTVTSAVSSVFSLITGNAYLATMLGASLLGVGIRVFKRLKH